MGEVEEVQFNIKDTESVVISSKDNKSTQTELIKKFKQVTTGDYPKFKYVIRNGQRVRLPISNEEYNKLISFVKKSKPEFIQKPLTTEKFKRSFSKGILKNKKIDVKTPKKKKLSLERETIKRPKRCKRICNRFHCYCDSKDFVMNEELTESGNIDSNPKIPFVYFNN